MDSEQDILRTASTCYLDVEGTVEKAGPEQDRRVRQRRSRVIVELRAHRLGPLRAVRPHILHVRSGRQRPCGPARGKGRLGALGLGRVK